MLLSPGFICLCFAVFVANGLQYFHHPVQIPYPQASRTPYKHVQFNTRNHADGSYHFGYDIGNDDLNMYREEKRDATGRVTGKYAYVDPTGILRIVEYVADKNGYRTRSSNRLFFDTSNLQLIGPIPRPQPRDTYKEKKADSFF